MKPELGTYILEENGKPYSIFEITHIDKHKYETYIVWHIRSEYINTEGSVPDYSNRPDNTDLRKLTPEEVEIIKLELL